ncbi:MAG TPA: PilZ domain-containing protein [Candidatus Hydrogenedentes bacterium]|nr:PilZ domain-containing protein [Candidatus Hydrogenedentota bacterium]
MQQQMHNSHPMAEAGQKGPDDKEIKRERRRVIRHQCRVHIEMLVRCESGYTGDRTTNTVEVKGRLLDLSVEGAMLHTKQNFSVGQELRLTIFLPDRPAVVTTASVRWCKPMPGKVEEFASGALFLTVSREGLSVIEAFLKELERALGNVT